MKTIAELEKIRVQKKQGLSFEKANSDQKIRVVVGMATCGISAGARPVMEAFVDGIAKKKLSNVQIINSGCFGMCRYEPIVDIYIPGQPKISYIYMTADKVAEIIEEHVINGKPVAKYMLVDQTVEDGKKYNVVNSLSDTNFFKKQKRIALRNCGIIDPEDIDEYLATDGYKSLEKVLTSMTPQGVIDEIKKSGLRGRGGGGFPTGLKWQFCHDAVNEQKYIVCNADEGDPGAFMDRSVLEGDPHSVIEAMMIAGFACGANEGYVYIRAEYPVAVSRLEIAIKQAREYGILGENIFNTGFNFNLHIRLGAGAFVCGEETALLTSIEGNRGEPRPRPPFPAVKGLFDCPTIINNVETFANIAQIILHGADWFASVGTEKSKGTKVFALGGKINNTGLVEIPIGTTLREIVYDIGGGISTGKEFKAAQTGGPSGGCIPKSKLDIPVDYERLVEIGSMMGSGGMIIMDENTCMVDMARFFLDFTVEESCGKCTPCRIGNKRMLEILDKIIDGNGTMEDLDKLLELTEYIKANSLCALGQSAPNPVISMISNFKDEYIAHIKDRHCPAGVCRSLLRFVIDPDKCKGCTLCKRNCPHGAIEGEVKKPHVIDLDKCKKCGICIDNCKFNAIEKI